MIANYGLHQTLRREVVPMGSMGMPVLLDSDEPASHVHWYFSTDRFGRQCAPVVKKVALGALSLIFVAGNDDNSLNTLPHLPSIVSSARDGRIFFPYRTRYVTEALATVRRAIVKRVKLEVFELIHARLTRPPEPLQQVTVTPLSAAAVTEAALLYSYDTQNIFSEEHFKSFPYFGAYMDGKLVGACCSYGSTSLLSGALIGGFVTHPMYRNIGIAKHLTFYCCKYLFESHKLISLHVETGNNAAKRVYTSLGFTEIGYLEQMNFMDQVNLSAAKNWTKNSVRHAF